MLKLLSEISKKILLAASTLRRAEEVLISLGSTINSEPSLGVLLSSMVSKVLPPSLESKMLTKEALILPLLVPATSQIIDRAVPPFKLAEL